MNDAPFFIRHFSRFSYPKKFLMVSLFFGFAVFVSSFFLVKIQYAAINTVKEQLAGINYEKNFNQLLEKIIDHELAAQRYLLGETEKKSEDKNEIKDLQDEIKVKLQAIEESSRALNPPQNLDIAKFNRHLTLIDHTWEGLSSTLWEMTPLQSLQAHITLKNTLLQQRAQATENAILVLSSSVKTFYPAALLVDLLPKIEVAIPQLMIMEENIKTTKEDQPTLSLPTISNLSFELQHTFIKTKDIYQLIKDYTSLSDDTAEAFENYLAAVETFIQMIRAEASEQEPSENSGESFQQVGLKALTATFKLWDKTAQLILAALNEELSSIRQQLFSTLLLTFIGAALGLFLGFFVMKQISRPLTKLVEASQSLAEGDLSIRVAVNTQDEVGQVSEAFNQMVESLQELIGRLQWTGIQLTTSTTEISAAAKQQEASVVEQEATTKQIAVTAKEISTTAKDFARTMSDVSNTAEQTSSLASAGREGLKQMEGIMGQMVEASRNIASKLAILSEKAGNITSVITTITKVADQTNLLSLNAAIEAEKAGEHGRSFSVIAKGIRRLADQTANATLDIEKMVHEILSAISAGVMGVDKFSEVIHSGVAQSSQVGEQLVKIIGQVQQLSKSFETVNQGMQAQSLGAEQINESISQLSDTARQTTESILHFHKAIDELNNAAQEMQSAVSRIRR